jgi:crotonobetaine/carnitine-CoA ligase
MPPASPPSPTPVSPNPPSGERGPGTRAAPGSPPDRFDDIVTLLRAQARRHDARTALRFPGADLTYAELDHGSDRVAAGLREHGVEPGERVVALLGNRPEFPLTWFGTAKLRAVFVPLNTALQGDLLRYELDDSDPKVVVIDASLLPAYDRATAPGRPRPVWVVGETPDASGDAPGRPPFTELIASNGAVPREVPSPSEPASILYTSGTTGRPKGTVLPHRRLVNTPREVGARAELEPDSTLFTALPLYHCNAQEKTALVAILHGLTAAFDDRFHASTFWETAARYRATHVALLTTMITVLWKQPGKPDDGTHGVRIATASGTPVAIWREFEHRFGLKIIESYGMTECGCTTLMNPPGAVRLGSVGRPLDFVEAQVVDDHDGPVPPGTAGELVVRPRVPFSMFLEYLGQPAQTVDAWRNLWFHTGDLMKQDPDGYYYFLDRKKDVIRRRGENIAPYDVEALLSQHPAVLECVVVGVPSELGEEDVKAVVQLKPGAQATAEELHAFAVEGLPAFMVPRYIEFVDAIPKTPNQKAQRYLLRGKRTGGETDFGPPRPPG